MLVVVVAVAATRFARGAISNAGARSDELPVDEDVVHDREADAVQVLVRGGIGALIVDERDARDPAARRNRRKLLSRGEASPRPLGPILGRGRLDTVGAPADEVRGVRPRRRLGPHVEARRTAPATAPATKIYPHPERPLHH